MRTVVIESPYAASHPVLVERNLAYLRAAMVDCLMRGEAPFASHGLYTQPGVLDDRNIEARNLGIDAGFEIGRRLGDVVFYIDYGMSPGMKAAKIHWSQFKLKTIHYRYLGDGLRLQLDKLYVPCRNSSCREKSSLVEEHGGFCCRCFNAMNPRM